MVQTIFKRVETKYLISEEEAEKLISIIEPYLQKDQYFKGTNMSIYFDTDERWLGIHSLEKPMYKEKIRVRSYEVPKSLDDTVFIEIKKKFDGVGYKRRVPIKLRDFYRFLEDREAEYLGDDGGLRAAFDGKNVKNYTEKPQIEEEVRYCFRLYHLRPALFLAYDRTSYVDRKDPTFRLTFDRKVRSRETDLRLEAGDGGALYFGKKNTVVMEIKSAECYPKWFVDAISRLKIYPASFSKYGKVLQKFYG
ncbi:polyphosphate polymerase domain-containing protein [Candidatus Saccharibacteria bacterium]|nr:polyphosphate polymerase domain-containing protein [Candidatus Saccharibacteria bacterium]